MSGQCSDKVALGLLLQNNPNDVRPVTWYNLIMEPGDAATPVDIKSDRIVHFNNFIKAQHFANKSGMKDSEIHPEIIDFLRDVDIFFNGLDPPTTLLTLFNDLKMEIEANNRDSDALFMSISSDAVDVATSKGNHIEEFVSGMIDDKSSSKFNSAVFSMVTQKEDVADKNNNTGILNIAYISFVDNLSKKLDSFKDIGADPSIEFSFEKIREMYYSSLKRGICTTHAITHSTLANKVQSDFYDNVHKVWPFLSDTQRSLFNSLYVLMTLDGSGSKCSWKEASPDFGAIGVSVDNRKKYRVNIKRHTDGSSVFFDSVPEINERNIKDILEKTKNKKKSTNLKFNLRNDDSFFRTYLKDVNNQCMKSDRPVSIDKNLPTNYEYRGDKLYKIVGDSRIPFDLADSNLSSNDKCHSLGMGFSTSTCSKLFDCIMSVGDGEKNFQQCKEILMDENAFKNIKDEIDFMHPQLVGKALDRLGFGTVKRADPIKHHLKPREDNTYWVYEDVESWSKKINYGTKYNMNPAEVKSIQENKECMKYLGLLVKYVEKFPIACTRNRDDNDRKKSSSGLSNFAKLAGLRRFVPLKQDALKFYSLKAAVPVRSIIRRSDNNVRLISAAHSNFSPFVGMMPVQGAVFRQKGGQKGGNGEFGDEDKCSQALYEAYTEQLKKLERLGKRLSETTKNKIMENLRKIKPLGEQTLRTIMELKNFNLAASYLGDNNYDLVDEKMLQDIMVKHNKYFDSYQRKIGRHGAVLANMALVISKENSKQTVHDDPDKPQGYRVTPF